MFIIIISSSIWSKSKGKQSFSLFPIELVQKSKGLFCVGVHHGDGIIPQFPLSIMKTASLRLIKRLINNVHHINTIIADSFWDKPHAKTVIQLAFWLEAIT